MRNLWWEHNRLLKLGSRGNDVKKFKIALNGWRTDKVVIDTHYDSQTVAAVIEFQRQDNLIVDGVAGPYTQCAVFESNYSYSIKKPPLTRQNRFLCWAAALESILRSTWKQPRFGTKMAELHDRYKTYTQTRGDISFVGINRVLTDLRVRGQRSHAGILRIERLARYLYKNQTQILLIDSVQNATVSHTRVIYGIKIKDGRRYLQIMDPISGYDTLSFDVLQSSERPVVLAIPGIKPVNFSN